MWKRNLDQLADRVDNGVGRVYGQLRELGDATGAAQNIAINANLVKKHGLPGTKDVAREANAIYDGLLEVREMISRLHDQMYDLYDAIDHLPLDD